jgi:hypothetical protein
MADGDRSSLGDGVRRQVTYLRIAVDDIEVATIDTEGRDVVSIHVGGTRTDDDYGVLRAV